MMRLLLIADKDADTREQVAEMFAGGEYQVIAAESVDVVLHDILKKNARVILLGSEFDDLSAGKLIPLLKKCNRYLTIILVSDEESLPLIRKFRKEGIFYHALKPVSRRDREELRQVVRCAFENSSARRWSTSISENSGQMGDA